MNSLRDRYCIVGVGETEYSRNSGRTTRAYAAGVTAPVKVGVQLPPSPGDLGEWLADGASFEAAGADALWVDLTPEAELDPVTVTAALAAVTYRSLLVLALPVSGASSDRKWRRVWCALNTPKARSAVNRSRGIARKKVSIQNR